MSDRDEDSGVHMLPDCVVTNAAPWSPPADRVAALEDAMAAMRRLDLHVAGTPEQERMRRLRDLAARTGRMYVAVDVYDRMTLGERMVFATARISLVRHPMLAPGTMTAMQAR